jgi:hypothetical protein
MVGATVVSALYVTVIMLNNGRDEDIAYNTYFTQS